MIFEGALLDVWIMKNRKENEVAYSVAIFNKEYPVM